jgi:hypothetical protein
MIKSIVMHDIPMTHIAAMERWYWRDHSPEIVGRYGPWEMRHDSYMPVPAPEEARAYGMYNWRVTECWWREIPKPGPQGCLSFTVPPVPAKVATCFIPAQPTEDFLGSEIQPNKKSILRWFILMKYPQGVAREEGEEWFLNTHVKEVIQQPGLYRFFSYQTVREPIGLPGHWPPGSEPQEGTTRSNWDRVSELWYENFDDWRKSVIEEPPRYTKPSWAKYERYPFLEPFEDFACSFLLERPTDEFLKNFRGYS